MELDFPSNLSEVWKEFNLKLQGDQGVIITDQQQIVYTSQTKSQDSFTTRTSNKLVRTKKMEFIMGFPTTEIVLNIQEIPPLDILYSPKHKAVMSRQKKRRRTQQSQLLIQGYVSMEIVWKDSQVDPSQDLKFAGAYASAAIDKASEVQKLMK